MSAQSPIFVKTEAFMVWLFAHTGKFPRHERFRLAKRIDDALFDFHSCLLGAASHPKQALPQLLQADTELDKLRTYLRLALELGYSEANQYVFSIEHTAELGKLLGGWLKTVKSV